MKARLFSKWGDVAGIGLAFGREASIGRKPGNDLQLDTRAVSGRHARIYFDRDRRAYVLEDLGSLNGTELDGRSIKRPERLGRLHVVNFAGACEFVFQEIDRSPEPETVAAPPVGSKTVIDQELPGLPAALGGGAAATQLPVAGGTRIEEEAVGLPETLAKPAASRRSAAAQTAVASRFLLTFALEAGPMVFRLREGPNLIGRSSRSQITIASMELSRRHATVRVEGDRVRVRDEGSRNKTYLDGEVVRGEVEVAPGAHLRFGLVEAVLDRRPEAREESGS